MLPSTAPKTKRTGLARLYPFNAEQTVNLLSEFGPLVTLFVVNAIYGVTAGIWALIGTTILSLIVMWIVLHRLPMFALIAGGITLIFSGISLYYDDPMWVQLKVTLFNAVFALFLAAGLAMNQNFFKYTFGKTFHYSEEGWSQFTKSFIALFLFLALANEAIRIYFWHSNHYDLFGWKTDGLNIWVMFKVVVVMPLTGLYAFIMTRRLQKYAIDPPPTADPAPGGATGLKGKTASGLTAAE
ncbi:MAG: septation protein IspZ [Hyphomicrobiaceae bacterium]|nr:septation protein IspZ [Hyphomicrobiaceae bacterium]